MLRFTSLSSMILMWVAAALLAQSGPDFKIDNNQLLLPSPIVFAAGSDELKPESEPALQHIAAFLKAKKYITLLRIEGHTDNQGDAAANQTLSERRALAVTRWLIAHETDCKRLIAVGFGSTKPVAPGDTPENRAKNVRIEARPAALAGKLIGGMPADGGGKIAGDPCDKK